MAIFTVTLKDGHTFKVKADTWQGAMHEARKLLSGTENRHSKKWKHTWQLIDSVNEDIEYITVIKRRIT
jgi:hypothetical protein